jgi:hypothetical protein
MKKVLLFGDSIQMGYQSYVRESLKGLAEVYGVQGNCQFSLYMLRWVNIWKDKEKWPDDVDVIHWNVGLWDVLRIYGDDTHTPIDVYGETLKRLYHRLKILFPNAKQVFATSTAVLEEKYEYPYQRYNADIEAFNKVAMETLTPLGVAINDLNAITKTAPDTCRSDMTHFYTAPGIKLVGEKVVNTICEQLGIPLEDKNDIEAVIPQLSKELVGN